MKTGRPEKTIHPDFQEYFKNDVNLKKEMKMAEKNKQTVTINEEEYALDDLTDLQKYMLEQVMDLKVKIKTTSMHLDQLKVASAEFSSSLAKSIKQKSQGEENEKT